MYLNPYHKYFKNHYTISSKEYNFNNYVIVVTYIIIFPGTCYVLVSSIQLALACARRNIWWEQLNLRSKFSYINERRNEIHISWFMLCAGVTFQLALVCARKYASWVQLLKPLSKKYFKNHAISSQDHNFNNCYCCNRCHYFPWYLLCACVFNSTSTSMCLEKYMTCTSQLLSYKLQKTSISGIISII